MFSRFDLLGSAAIPSENPVTLTFWNREVIQQGNTTKSLCCDAVVEFNSPIAIVQMFESLASGVLPIDPKHPPELPYRSLSDTIIDLDGKIAPKWIVPIEYLPPKFREFCRSRERDLSGAISTFVTTLRWVQGASGGHRPFASVGSYWSLNGEDWQPLPSDHRVIVTSPKGIDARPNAMSQIAGLLEHGHGEPFAHELLREAIQISASSPRSGLLIGVSALEFAIKQHLSDLIPGSDIIVEKMPSPPLVEIIQELIPSILEKSGVTSEIFPLDDKDKNYLRKWILKRNKLSHGALRQIDDVDLRRFLEFVRKLLYQIDTENGHSWALSVELETQVVLGRG